MKIINKLFAGIVLVALCHIPSLNAQEVQGFVHQQSEENGYMWPTDNQVLSKLDKWQDQKFGVLFHWGLYSVPGIVESWSLCSEDEEWIPRKKNISYDDYQKVVFRS